MSKKSPQLRFEGFTDDWEERKLSDLFIKGGSGGTPKSTNKAFYDGDIPFLGISDITKSNGFINNTEKHISSDGLNSSAAWIVSKGAISLAMYASVGKLAILNIDAATSQAFYNMIFDDYDLRDLVYQRLNKANELSEWNKLISTGTQSNLNADKVKNFQMYLPKNHDEIKLISTFFKQIDNTIALHQRKLDLLKEQKKGFLQKMFPKNGAKVPELRFAGFADDWEERKLGDTETHFTDGNYGESYPSAKDMSDKANGIPFLRGSDFSNGYLDSSNANYIKPEKHAELTSGHIKQDDIVLAVRGSLGTLGYATKENEGWNINSQLAILRTNKSEISGMFLIQYLLGSKGQKEIFSRNTGTALKQLPIKQLKDIPVPVPTLLEQQKIGNFFKELDSTIALHQRKLDLLKEQKKGYLQKMFPKTGEKIPELRFAGFADDWEERKAKEMIKTHHFRSYLAEPNDVGNYEVIQQGDKPIAGYANGEPFEYFYDVTLFGDHTVSLFKPTKPFFIATDGVKIISADEFDGRYFYVTLERYKPASQGYKRHFTILKNEDIWFTTNKDEQVKIGTFFKQLDDIITLHQRKLDLLKEQKKGFLQKMFV